MIEQIKSLSKSFLPSIVGIRRHIHAHPELSFEEIETSKYIAEHLTAWGIPYEANIGGHGILATIKGNQPGSGVVALRGDMDALPIQETADVSYRSTKAGVMHACGHDVHTSSLLGALKILNELKDHWGGTVQGVFQPAEETLPGGASLMLKAGVFDSLAPQEIFGQHVFPELVAGKVGFRPGAYMASTDEIYIRVIGKGGHGAKPDQVIDPVLIASHLIVALQQVSSRWGNPQMPTVLSFGKFIAQGATNVIPNDVFIEGTFRTFDENWRNEAHERIKQLASNLVEGMGGKIELRIERGYPVLHNNEALTERAKLNAITYLGEENVIDLDMRTTAEDFAYFAQAYPSCFYRLGTASPDGSCAAPVHNSNFQVNEHALEIGMGLMAYEAIQELKDLK